jgi:L-methionine (R)-S-oxide reductase
MKEEEKRELYEKSISEMSEIFVLTKDREERMHAICTILKRNMSYYFWVGFYYPKNEYMQLGPSEGPPACTHISYSGVCGAALRKKTTLIVPDVNEFEGHVACDPRSKSEIVVPVFIEGEITAVLDVDSEEPDAFDGIDELYIEKVLLFLTQI